MAVHGISVVEVRRDAGSWIYVKDSPFNRRLTCLSENNYGTGKTPWGSFLTGEENWFGYFTRGATDDATRGDMSSASAATTAPIPTSPIA